MRPLRGLQETRVATREESGVLGFPSRRGLTPRGRQECNPEIPAFPGDETFQFSSVAQSCLTPSDPMDCSPPGSPIHGILQARVLEWGAIALSKTE